MESKETVLIKIKGHSLTPYIMTGVGLGGIVWCGYGISKEPPADIAHMVFWGAGMLISLFLLPGVADTLGRRIGRFQIASGLSLPWGKKPE